MTLITTNKKSFCLLYVSIENRECMRVDTSFTSITSNLFNDACILTGCFLRDYLTNKV